MNLTLTLTLTLNLTLTLTMTLSGLNAALESLRGTPAYASAQHALQSLEPFTAHDPPPGYTPVADLSKIFEGLGGWLNLGLDPRNGAITHLSLSNTSHPTPPSWASPSHPLALVRYQTLVEADLVKWRAGFLQPWTITPQVRVRARARVRVRARARVRVRVG